MNITLAGKTFPLMPPTGMAALDVRLAFPRAENRPLLFRWSFAVVGLSWAGKKLPCPDVAACKHDLIAYGEQVYAALVSEGLIKSDADILAVDAAAAEIVGALSPKKEEVEKARDF